ncbi:unnamed protein product [Cuscuta epithymum]|uniref:Uncharacterized protein n=1 Tax=Cuscuta epithymum TaxID=186058 RepID=A0AAV0DW26_9ASTE|nr:unnamed protein product [Cuscuta epithymum]
MQVSVSRFRHCKQSSLVAAIDQVVLLDVPSGKGIKLWQHFRHGFFQVVELLGEVWDGGVIENDDSVHGWIELVHGGDPVLPQVLGGGGARLDKLLAHTHNLHLLHCKRKDRSELVATLN